MHNLGLTRSSQQSKPSSADARHICTHNLARREKLRRDLARRPVDGSRIYPIHSGDRNRWRPRQHRRSAFHLRPRRRRQYRRNGTTSSLSAGGYAYLPTEDAPHTAAEKARLAVIEKSYETLHEVSAPQLIISREDDVASHPLSDDPDLQVKCLLPDEMSFDFAVNTMSLPARRALRMVEIHVMEHGLLMLEGGGIYRLGDHWYPVTAGDFIWMAPYCPQWFGALGKVSRKIPHLQRLEPPSASERTARMTLASRLSTNVPHPRLETLAAFSDAQPPPSPELSSRRRPARPRLA